MSFSFSLLHFFQGDVRKLTTSKFSQKSKLRAYNISHKQKANLLQQKCRNTMYYEENGKGDVDQEQIL